MSTFPRLSLTKSPNLATSPLHRPRLSIAFLTVLSLQLVLQQSAHQIQIATFLHPAPFPTLAVKILTIPLLHPHPSHPFQLLLRGHHLPSFPRSTLLLQGVVLLPQRHPANQISILLLTTLMTLIIVLLSIQPLPSLPLNPPHPKLQQPARPHLPASFLRNSFLQHAILSYLFFFFLHQNMFSMRQTDARPVCACTWHRLSSQLLQVHGMLI